MSLKILQKIVRDSAKAAFAEGTYKSLRVQWRAYFFFCEFYGLTPIPTTTETLCLYGQFLGRSFRSVESVQNYISGIKSLHYILDIKFPLENKVKLELMLKGMARESSHMPNWALPITAQILNDMLNFFKLREC